MTLSYALQFPKEVAGMILNLLLKTPLAKSMAFSMAKQTFAPEQVPEKYAKELYAIGFRSSHFRANREDVLVFPETSKILCEEYKKITVPTVIAVGENDPFGVIDQARRLKEDIPMPL